MENSIVARIRNGVNPKTADHQFCPFVIVC